MEEITEKVVNVPHEKFELFEKHYSKRLESVTRNLENFRSTTSEELAETSKNIKLLENISNNLISNKSYETQDPLKNLSSPRQPLQNTENVQNNNNDSSPKCANLNTLMITKNRKMVSKEKKSLEQLRLSTKINDQLIDLRSKNIYQ